MANRFSSRDEGDDQGSSSRGRLESLGSLHGETRIQVVSTVQAERNSLSLASLSDLVYLLCSNDQDLATKPSATELRCILEFLYDVFLSFRGSDTRKGITSELHRQLTERGIKTFMDTNIQVGEVISPTLLKAIEESRFAIIILSPDYASSTWCLQELAKICQCMEYNNRILPIFLNVKPDDARVLKRSFEEAFTNYGKSGLYTSEKLQEWKDALTKVANCSGWNSNKYNTERELVKKIVEDMYNKVQPIDNKGDLEEFEAKREAMNKAHVVSGATISGSNVNMGIQGDFIKSISGNFFKDVKGNVNQSGPSNDIIGGDRGGDGGDSYNGGFAGVGGQVKGNNTFNYG